MIEFPDNIRPQSMGVGLRSNTKVFDSTFNGSTLTSQFQGSKITLSMTFDSLDTGFGSDADEAGELSAFLFELDGRSNLAKIPMFHRAGKPAQGVPSVASSNASGGLLQTEGWLPNREVLRKGDFFTVNNELKMLLAPAVSDNLGNATLQFAPWLRTSPQVGDKIITDLPYGIFRSDSDDMMMDFVPMNGSITLTFTESFYV